ncbi:hypothetical protein BC628DRAFT_1376486 [Trametes gibbosa]|nr:hypothetical protein BC628DRAFT_1376486 [Trametes gibbosa]
MRHRIGTLRVFHENEVKHIRHSEETVNLRPGDIFETFDHICEWDEDCVSFEKCESWRGEGDPLCDAALRDVFDSASSSVGKELLSTLEEHSASEAVQAFLNEVHQTPPAGILASDEEVALAQEFFLDNSIQIMQALLHYSLAGGFASPRIVATLEAVSYLVPHVQKDSEASPSADLSAILGNISKASTDRTFSRLSETFQFVLDVMGCFASPTPVYPISNKFGDKHRNEDHERPSPIEDCSDVSYLMPGGEGWNSTVRVRLLHGIARWRVQERWDREGHAQAGVPISQEDMAATLAAFSTVPIWCLNRLGMAPSPASASAYLALWRHVGFYLGVSPPILLRHFRDTRAADKFLATAALHLFSPPSPSTSSSSSSSPSSSSSSSAPPPSAQHALRHGPTIPILLAVSNRAPLHNTLAHNLALTTHLLGPALAAHLRLPRAPLRARLRVHAVLALQRAAHAFARCYPRAAWRAKRRAVLREGIVRSVRWNLGQRRTTFRPRTMRGAREGGGDGDGHGDEGGELAPGVSKEEVVARAPVRAKVLARMWSEVLMEEVAVCAVAGVLGVGVGYVALVCAVRGCMG